MVVKNISKFVFQRNKTKNLVVLLLKIGTMVLRSAYCASAKTDIIIIATCLRHVGGGCTNINNLIFSIKVA